jgi:2-polyprenyl-3-methyl-5-hydroxy-6-metoxy-1,4-benzoquinol methylase
LQTTTTWKWKLAQTLEYKWWENYLKNKNTQEYLDWKLTYWDKLIFSITPYFEFPENKRILDAGCGPAGIFMALKGNQVDALDPLIEKYKSLPHFLPHAFSWTQFNAIALEDLQAENTYDYIFCMNAINHVNDINKCYDNLVRALKPNGILVISTDAHKHSFLKKIFQLIPGDVLHPIQHNLQEYNQYLTERNLSILKDILYKEELIFDYYITIAKK